MITIQLYWNNICILHRQELAFLEQVKADLKKKDIDLSVTCFGLGIRQTPVGLLKRAGLNASRYGGVRRFGGI